MNQRVFLAGATGAIGCRLVPMLVREGFEVFGTTRHAGKAAQLRESGANAVVLDVYDAQAVRAAVEEVRPAAVIHQLTDLPRQLSQPLNAEMAENNARIRRTGTANLVSAAVAAGCTRFIAQSIAWAYAPGTAPHDESQPLDLAAQGNRAITVNGVAALESQVLSTPGLRGAVLRYGQLWGPLTGKDSPQGDMPVHVDAAAHAALLALQLGAEGVFNIAQDNPFVDVRKAQRELGWSAGYRLEGATP